MAGEDYYKILGITKNSSGADIKKAYRKLAMKYHPDRTKGDIRSENKFKKISEAYAVLSDGNKRKQYDNFGSEGFHKRYSREDIFKNFDFGNIFGDFAQKGHFSFGDFQFNQSQRLNKGSDLVYEIVLTLEEVALGSIKMINFEHEGNVENISVKIPQGMISGKKLRLAGKGGKSRFGGVAGDLFIKSRVLPHDEFTVEGYDLSINREILLTKALLGTSIVIPTIGGGQLNLKVPFGTKHKSRMRLANKGLPHMSSSSKGDLYVIINVKIPNQLSDIQKKMIQKLSETGL